PALRLEAVGLGSGQGVLKVKNGSPEEFGKGSIELYYDDRENGSRKSAGTVPVDKIPVGGEVDIAEGGGIDFAKLFKHGPIDHGSVVVIYSGPLGAEPLAARQCDCPGVWVSDPADAANDCAGL